MKKPLSLLLISTSLFLISCGNSPQEELIKKVVETQTDSSIIDMHFHSKKCEKIKEVKGADSLQAICSSWGNDATPDNIVTKMEEGLKEYQNRYDLDMKKYHDNLKGITENKGNILLVESYKIWANKYLNDAKNEMVTIQKLKAYISAAKNYITEKDKVFGNIWQCTYTIVQGTNSTVERTDKYLFNADNTKVYSRLDNKQ